VCVTDGRLNEMIHFRKDEANDRLRMQKMIELTESHKNDFRCVEGQASRSIMSTLIKNVPLLDQLVKLIPEDSITGFQLKDLVRKCYSFDELKEAIIAKMADKSYMIDPRLAGDEPSEENEKQDKYNARKEAEKEAKMGFPTNDPIEILEQAGCKEFY
jgi:hypothetical protein